MVSIKLFEFVGSFAENKDVAQILRNQNIIPALDRGEDVILDFTGIDATTQSFIHALISDLIRTRGSIVLEQIQFKHCTEIVQKVVGIVVDYMQEA